MKRNSLFTKLLAMMLCVMMVIGCLPLSALADANDWEGEIDPADPIPGSDAEHAILLTELENYVNIPAGETVYYQGYFSGTNMTVSGNEGFVVIYNGEEYSDNNLGFLEPIPVDSGNPRMPVQFSITNNSGADASYYIGFAYPEGTMDNPQDLWDGENTVALEAGNMGYFFDFVNYNNGYVTFTISGTNGWQWQINNETASVYGDLHDSGETPAVNSQTFKYNAEEEYVLMVNSFNSEDPYNAPAGDVTVEVTFVPGWGTEEDPYVLYDLVNNVTIEGEEAVYYQGYFAGMDLTVSGEGNFSVIYEGETFSAVDGKVEISVPAGGMGRPMPTLIGIVGAGDYSIVATYPAGAMDNPAVAVLGDNPASIAEGNSQGYYYTWIATKDGELTFKVPAATEGVEYDISVLNFSTWAMKTLAADGVDGVLTIPVTAGDEFQIVVSTLPDASWNYPAAEITMYMDYAGCEHTNTTTTTVDATCDTAGSVTVTCSDCGEIVSTEEIPALGHDYTGEKGACVNCGAYQPAANLKYMATWALSFQDYIGMSNMVSNSGKYDRLFIVATQVAPNGEVTTETLEGERYGTTSYYSFVKQILAWSMSENVTLELFGEKDGVVYAGQSTVASVESLALDMLAKYDADGNALNCQVLVDMLNYGAAVQTAYNHFANNLPNTQITEYADYATAETPSMTAVNTSEGSGAVKISNTGISMQDKVMLTVMVQMSKIEGYEVRCEVGGVTTTATEIVPIEGMAAYGIASFAVTASNMREVHTIAIYNSETGEVASAVYSLTVEAFANKNLGGQYNDVAVTLMKYGDSVYAYANQ